MQSFLESVLDDFHGWRTHPEDCVFVLPSKRAGFFLKNLMASRAAQTMLSPRILSIESFVERIAGLRYASPVQLLFSLYEAFLEQEGVEKESFFEFSKWGTMLLQDFNEIDRYLVDTDSFFEYLGSIQEIRQWTLDGSSTPMIDRRVRFWKALKPIYHRLRERLASEGLGYQGQVYREAVDALPHYLEQHTGITHVFLGFNALNRAEETIIQKVLESGDHHIYWDADPHYLDNPQHDAGLFMRKHLRSWNALKNSDLKGLSRYFRKAKSISITGLPKAVSQAKFCGQLLEKIQQEDGDALSKTALILGEESLLNPVLHSLPSSLKGVNVTMGYPLKDTPLAHLFEVLFELLLRRTPQGLPVKEFLRALSHPFLQGWFQMAGADPAQISAKLIRENTFYLRWEALDQMPFPLQWKQLYPRESSQSPQDLIQGFIALIEALKPAYTQEKNGLGLEYLHHFHLLFNQLDELCRLYPFVNEVKALRMLYGQLLEEGRIDFQGEPLQGLQVMGMLESRNLDFETVIITSVNEGILPSGKSQNSFIPFDVKREFGLPTYKEKDAVYTYHFYRILQRARRIYITYNTEPDVLEGGEPSRFIHQLLNDPLLEPCIRHSLASPEAGTVPVLKTTIAKSVPLLKRIQEKALDGLSPTSLSQYIADPLSFYRKSLLGIQESDTLEETIAANTFGTVIHESLESLYEPLVGEILTREHLEHLRASAPDELQKAFQKNYLKGGQAKGKNLIALRVMQTYLELFLRMEEKRIGKHEVRLLGVEQRLRREITGIPGQNTPIWLKGTVDRIEAVDGQLHIIDYKTGKVAPSDLRIRDWEDLRTNPAKSKAFQVLCYGWLVQGQPAYANSGFRAGVFSFKNMGSGFQWFGEYQGARACEEEITTGVLERFQASLRALVGEIFNPQIPLTQSETA